LHAWTLGGAFASFEEARQGSIAAGKFADFVVLSEDPTRVAPDSIRNIQVEMTVIRGKVAFERHQ
jgi:predicted amidohydrolase YtcJ